MPQDIRDHMPQFAAFTRSEVDSTYVERDERFVVSLIIGYEEVDMAGETDEEMAKDACHSALELTRDGGHGDTQWRVFDRKTKTMRMFEQSEFDPERVGPERPEPDDLTEIGFG